MIVIILLGIGSAVACNYCKNKGWCENERKKKKVPDKKLTVIRPKLRLPEPEEEPEPEHEPEPEPEHEPEPELEP